MSVPTLEDLMHRLRPPLKGFGQRGPSGKIQRTAIRKIQRKRRRRRRLRLWRATGLVVPIVGNAKKTKGVEERQAEERQAEERQTGSISGKSVTSFILLIVADC